MIEKKGIIRDPWRRKGGMMGAHEKQIYFGTEFCTCQSSGGDLQSYVNGKHLLLYESNQGCTRNAVAKAMSLFD